SLFQPDCRVPHVSGVMILGYISSSCILDTFPLFILVSLPAVVSRLPCAKTAAVISSNNKVCLSKVLQDSDANVNG
ncbi:MAG: hypothetical protein RSF79_09505, partial [Janthinobacterium sp.]